MQLTILVIEYIISNKDEKRRTLQTSKKGAGKINEVYRLF